MSKSFKNLKKSLSNKTYYLPIDEIVIEVKTEEFVKIEEVEQEAKEVEQVEEVEEVKYTIEPIEIELDFNNIYECNQVVKENVNAMNKKVKFSDIVNYIVVQNKFLKNK